MFYKVFLIIGRERMVHNSFSELSLAITNSVKGISQNAEISPWFNNILK